MGDDGAVFPDAAQVEQQRARKLLELASYHVREALKFPDEMDVLRAICARQLLELAMLREHVEHLEQRIAVLEKRS